MFRNDDTLRAAGENVEYTKDQINEIIRCKEDIIYFASNYFFIKTIDHGKIKIPLYEYQKKILKSMVEPMYLDGVFKPHIYALLPRQSGKTTLTTIYIVWWALFHKDKTCYILANKAKTAIEIMYRIQTGYKELPLWLQSGVVEWGKESFALENGVRIMSGTTSSDSISGQSVALLYIDEFAKIPEHIAEDFIAGTYPVIASGKTSKIIITTTPKGLNFAYDFWKNAVDKKNNFYPIKVGWWEHPDRDAQWKKNMIADIGVQRFKQEFGMVFLGSEDTLIDADILSRQPIIIPIDVKFGARMNIYEKPIPGESYLIGVDPASGITGFGDYSTCQIIRHIDDKNFIQVGTFRDRRIKIEDFAQICVSISKYYNDGVLIVESNLHGEQLCKLIWHTYECDALYNEYTNRLGVTATRKSKTIAIMSLKRFVEESWVILQDKYTVDELSRFVDKGNGSFGGSGAGNHDDLVAALYWVFYYITTYYQPNNDDGEAKTIDREFVIEDGEFVPRQFREQEGTCEFYVT